MAGANAVDLISQWNDAAPLAHSMPTFHWTGNGFTPLWSTLGVFEADARDCELDIKLSAPCVTYHPAAPALTTVFWTVQKAAEEQFEHPDTTPFSLFTRYLEEHGLAPAGDCVLYPLLTSREEGHSRSYYQCWMPYR